MQNLVSRSEAGITFDVSDVDIATDLLPEQTMRIATERAVNSIVESCGNYTGRAICNSSVHQLYSAVGLAFHQHRPLVLSPDIIWLTIAQGLSAHINQDPEKHRDKFVSHQGQKQITIRRDDFVPGTLENPWQETFTEFGLAIREDIGNSLYQLIVSNFSTTGAVERAASEIALMETVSAFFSYDLVTLCGIPRVTLEGTVLDWVELAAKVDSLQKFCDTEFWVPALQNIAKQLVNTAEGEVDRSFWLDMYKVDNMSGGPYIDGWISHLIPYVNGGEKNPCLRGGSITESQMPTGISKVPFVWDNLGEQTQYEFLSGMVAVQQNPDTLALRPKIGWAVRKLEQF